MLSHDFYHSTIRKYVILFGSLFNDIHIDRVNSSNNVVTTLKVPISYGPKEKFLARLNNDPSLSRPFAMVLPRISFQIDSMYYDGARKLTSINKTYSADSSSDNKGNYIYNPVPYNFNFQLFVMVKNQEDGTRILEQILPFFTPDWTSSVNLIPELGIYRDIPIVLNNISVFDSYENNFEVRRAIIWTLNFTLKGYLFGPTHSAKVIKKAIVNFYTPVNNYFTFKGDGSLTTNSNTNLVVGDRTDFTIKNLGIGAKLYFANGLYIGTVNTIANTNALYLTANAPSHAVLSDFRYTPNTVTNAARVERIEVTPGLTANGQPTSNASLSIDYNSINANDNYGFITEFISDE
jgi:hypothetical protein